MKTFLFALLLTASVTFGQRKTSIDGEPLLTPSMKRPVYLVDNKSVCPTCEYFVIDDQRYAQIAHNNKVITVTHTFWDDYVCFLVVISNRSDQSFLFDPGTVTVDYTKGKDPVPAFATYRTETAIHSSMIVKKIEKNVRWRNALAAAFGGLATRTVTSDTSGTASVRDQYGRPIATGTYNGTTTARVPDTGVQNRIARANAERSSSAGDTASIIQNTAFLKNTIFPNDVRKGFIYLKKPKFTQAAFIFPVDGYEYVILYQKDK